MRSGVGDSVACPNSTWAIPPTTVTTRNGREYTGELLYLYEYPHAVQDKHGTVLRFEQRPQRVGLNIGGAVWHFTVPAKVEALAW